MLQGFCFFCMFLDVNPLLDQLSQILSYSVAYLLHSCNIIFAIQKLLNVSQSHSSLCVCSRVHIHVEGGGQPQLFCTFVFDVSLLLELECADLFRATGQLAPWVPAPPPPARPQHWNHQFVLLLPTSSSLCSLGSMLCMHLH